MDMWGVIAAVFAGLRAPTSPTDFGASGGATKRIVSSSGVVASRWQVVRQLLAESALLALAAACSFIVGGFRDCCFEDYQAPSRFRVYRMFD